MDTAPKMEDIAPSYIRIWPDVRARLDAYLKRNPQVRKATIFNNALNRELAHLETLEPKQEVAA